MDHDLNKHQIGWSVNNVKICLVSPELVNVKRVKQIKKIISFLKKKNFKIDAVCTKKPKLWSKLTAV